MKIYTKPFREDMRLHIFQITEIPGIILVILAVNSEKNLFTITPNIIGTVRNSVTKNRI